MATVKEPYGLHPGFEELVLFYTCTSERFWSRAAHVVDPESLTHPLSKLVFETARQIAKDTGHGPSSAGLMIQRLARRVHEGKVTVADLDAVNTLIDRVADLPPPDMEAVLEELVPVLRRRLFSNAILMSHDEWAKHGDFSLVSELIDKAKRLGEVDLVQGTRLNAAGFDEIRNVKLQDRLPLGILELDIQLGNGLPNGQLGVWIGDSGGGKSIALAHQAAEATRRQMFTGFVTLELPKPVQLARLYSNLIGVPVNQILDNDEDLVEAERRITLCESALGICEVAEFPPHATTTRDIVQWIDQKEQEHGVKMQVLVVDYADKLYEPRVKDNDYVAMRYVYEGLRRDIAVARGMWVWTGSQASRPSKESQKKLDLHHVADSMHKVRVADLIVTLNPRDDGQMEFFVAKNRMGRSRYTIGPVVTDFERARIVPLSRELMAW